MIYNRISDDGSEGFGQISTYDADISATVFHRKIAPFALGTDPADIDALVALPPLPQD
ncbi:MAG: hypothetical protein JSW23_04400 [Planctomycetota bacterium]|nr:MAG: hypothetical protein JSW23_04400 [Planctomycetota bacterium]